MCIIQGLVCVCAWWGGGCAVTGVSDLITDPCNQLIKVSLGKILNAKLERHYVHASPLKMIILF